MNQNSMKRALTKLHIHRPCTRNTPMQFQSQSRSMGTGPRGARGHGWLQKYRAGLGGRHLQGRYHNRDVEKLSSINDLVFSMNETHASKVSTPTVAYLDFAVEGESTSSSGTDKSTSSSSSSSSSKAPLRVVIELASAALPNTCRNFVDLCEADDGNVGYKSSKVFKILPQVGLCLGDTTVMNNGEQGKCSPSVVESGSGGGNSDATFAHEATVLSHAQKGIVTMLSTGLDKNDSRFMIMTADDAPHLDGKFVAFGRVKEGLDDLQKIVENTYTQRGLPTTNIEIVGCGTL